MKKTFFIFLLLFFTASLFSQQADQRPLQNVTPYNVNAYKVMKYKKMQTTGIVMISAGSVALISGVALYVSGLATGLKSNLTTSQYYNGSTNSLAIPGYEGKIIAGSALGLVGGLAVAGGIVIYKIGKRKEQIWSNKVSVVVLPNAFRIAYKF